MKRSPLLLAACGWLIAGFCAAGAPARMPVQDVRPLLVAAINAPDGNAYGVLTGPIADAISRRFDTAAPLFIDVSTVRRYRQSGCRRLNVAIRQQGVHLPHAREAKNQRLDVGIDYCRTGLPPESLVEETP